MLFILGKLVQPFLYPFNLSLITLVLGTCLLWIKNLKAAKILITFGVVVILLTSMPALTYPLFFSLEKEIPAKNLEDYPTSDVIVVLGGTVSKLIPPRRHGEEINGSRVVPAFLLWKMKKAPLILVSSGSNYSIGNGHHRIEAEDMRDLLISLGVPSQNIVLENRARNTHESAVYTADWLRETGKKSVLLVTSAFHMPRSVFLFNQVGIDAIAVPTDYKVTYEATFFDDYIPKPDGATRLNVFIKEKVGLYAYKWMGPFNK